MFWEELNETVHKDAIHVSSGPGSTLSFRLFLHTKLLYFIDSNNSFISYSNVDQSPNAGIQRRNLIRVKSQFCINLVFIFFSPFCSIKKKKLIHSRGKKLAWHLKSLQYYMKFLFIHIVSHYSFNKAVDSDKILAERPTQRHMHIWN